MKLESVTLRNFRCFERLHLDLHPELTILVADNGGGKSTSLDALAIVLSNYVEGFPLHNATLRKMTTSDHRQVIIDKTLLTSEVASAPVIILAIGSSPDITPSKLELIEEFPLKTKQQYLQELDQKRGKERAQPDTPAFLAEEYYQRILDKKSVDLPLIAYYGTERVWQQTEAKWHDTQQNKNANKADHDFLSRLAPYSDCLDSGTDYISFVDWFQYIAKAHADQRNMLIEKYGHPSFPR